MKLTTNVERLLLNLFAVTIGIFLMFSFPEAGAHDSGNAPADPISGVDETELAAVQNKRKKLEMAVTAAKAKGIDTRYEEVTLSTSGLFLNTYIPWDMAHSEELTAAYSESRQEFLKGTAAEEAKRTPLWELEQVSFILDRALENLDAAVRNPDSRRPVPRHDVSNLDVVDGFLSADGRPVFSGGFIWAPYEISRIYSGYIGNDIGFPELIGFNRPDSKGSLGDSSIARMLRKLDVLQANNQKGSIGFGHSIPRWAVERWPDINAYKTHHYNYDIDHPQVKNLWSNMLGQLVPAMKDHPSVFDYQLAIEPQWPSVGDWQVNNASPHTFKRYHSWLGDRYASVDELNRSWGTDFGSFEEVSTRPEDDSNPAIWYDWCRFNQYRVTDFFRFMRDEIQRHDPEAKCHIRVSVGGINQGLGGRFPNSTLHRGIDREALVELTQINGLDNFLEDRGSGRTHNLYDEKDYAMNWLGHTMLLDYIRSLAPDNLIYDSEWHSVSSVYYLNPELPEGYMHTALWLSSLHGLGATKTWYWSRREDGRPGRFANEFYSSPLVQPRILNEYGVGLAQLNAFGKEVVALGREPKQIYLLYSEASAIQSLEYLNNQMVTYEALQFTGLPVGFVTENDLMETGLPESCKLLIVADAGNVSEHTVYWLQGYVTGGRDLLIVGDNALKFNEHGKSHDPEKLEFLSDVEQVKIDPPKDLLDKIEAHMAETDVKRSFRCIESKGGQPAWGIMCRSTEIEGGYLVCLINLATESKKISIEIEGNTVSSAVDLFQNELIKVHEIEMDPLTVRLYKIVN